METLQIEILNPKAKKLLEDLASQNFIAIRNSNSPFQEVLKKIGVLKREVIPSEEEILLEVGEERAARYKQNMTRANLDTNCGLLLFECALMQGPIKQ